MTSGVIQNLARATRTVAAEPDPCARFGMAVGFLCDIALQTDIDGLWIAVERGVDDYAPRDEGANTGLADLGVPIVRDPDGRVVELRVEDTEFAHDSFILLAREIALLPESETRIVALEAVVIELIRDNHAGAAALLTRIIRVRREGLGPAELNVLLARDERDLSSAPSDQAGPRLH